MAAHNYCLLFGGSNNNNKDNKLKDAVETALKTILSTRDARVWRVERVAHTHTHTHTRKLAQLWSRLWHSRG